MYMILSKWNNWENKNEVFGVKCAKRGNDVYRFRVYRRFREFCSMAGDAVFFNPKDRGDKKTRALWITLTYDAKRCSFREGWSSIGIEFNRFMKRPKNLYGLQTYSLLSRPCLRIDQVQKRDQGL